MDSGETGYHWGRLSLGCHLPPDTLIRTYAYAADTKLCGHGPDLGRYLEGLGPAAAAAAGELFTPAGSSEDFYLDRTGRYLWLFFELISSGEAPAMYSLGLHMGGDHMADYLPAVYRSSDFTKRFVSLFDSFFMDLEREIERLPARFDYESAEENLLRDLAEWVCVEHAGLAPPEIRARIRTALEDYEDLYTLRGVKRSVARLTGREPFIIENADVDPNSPDCPDSALYRKLYGENPFKFVILLGEDCFQGHGEVEAFLKKMRGLIPANTEFELVTLKYCTQLDWHTYLGVNSVVGSYVAAVIDENAAIHYDTTIGVNRDDA
jgi:phage tail-like protein